MQLACPEDLDITPQQLPYLQSAQYQCRDAQGQQVGGCVCGRGLLDESWQSFHILCYLRGYHALWGGREAT